MAGVPGTSTATTVMWALVVEHQVELHHLLPQVVAPCINTRRILVFTNGPIYVDLLENAATKRFAAPLDCRQNETSDFYVHGLYSVASFVLTCSSATDTA